MRKLKLIPDPTFKCKVPIPVPGAPPVDVEFTFRHQTVAAFDAWNERNRTETRKDLDVISDIACGWDLVDAFDAENLQTLLQNYPASTRAISTAYIAELLNVGKR